jgi:dUTP pyrophosphatase
MASNPVVSFKRLFPERDHDIPLPCYMSPHAAGMDLCAALEAPLTIAPGQICLVPTGLAMSLPVGYEAQVRPRSGLAVKHGIGIINAPGTIDSDYRGEVKVALINMGPEPYTLERGQRMAQMIIQRVYQAEVRLATQLDTTQRNEGGFGSTGS